MGTIADRLLGTDQPACLWITPSTTIRDQTLRALQRPTHPYREALQHSLGSSVEVVTLEEALTRPQSVDRTRCWLSSPTIQSYRIRDERTGEELSATRRIYRDNGYLQDAFNNLPAWAEQGLVARRERAGQFFAGQRAAPAAADRYYGQGAQRADAGLVRFAGRASGRRSSWN